MDYQIMLTCCKGIPLDKNSLLVKNCSVCGLYDKKFKASVLVCVPKIITVLIWMLPCSSLSSLFFNAPSTSALLTYQLSTPIQYSPLAPTATSDQKVAMTPTQKRSRSA
jgi:hypothetical protein